MPFRPPEVSPSSVFLIGACMGGSLSNTYHYLKVFSPVLLKQLARWQCPVASSKALDLIHRAMCMVTYWRIAVSINMASNVGVFCVCCLFACHSGGRCSKLPGASSIALNLLHGVILRALLQHVCMAIKMACNGGTVAHRCHLFA